MHNKSPIGTDTVESSEVLTFPSLYERYSMKPFNIYVLLNILNLVICDEASVYMKPIHLLSRVGLLEKASVA